MVFECLNTFINIEVLICTVGLQSLSPFPLYVAKLSTLITGGVGGAGPGEDPPTCKMGTFFQIPWH